MGRLPTFNDPQLWGASSSLAFLRLLERPLLQHGAFYEHVESYVMTERLQTLGPNEQLKPVRPQRVPQAAIDSFDFEPWLPWNYGAGLSKKPF